MGKNSESGRDRRAILGLAGTLAGTLAAGALLGACAPTRAAPSPAPEEGGVTPVEDLMREHGVLRRVLQVYDEVARRMEAGEPPALDVLAAGTRIIQRFIEAYHEELEERFVFPRFRKADRLTDLVAVLWRQHDAGRLVTARIQEAIASSGSARAGLLADLRAFTRMYRAHAAREDTVLFPELRLIVGAEEYAALGDVFEEQERALFGARGFEGFVAEVAHLEDALGIGDLAKLTPS